MTLKQAIKRLAVLGFKMELTGGCIHGTRGAEAFNYSPHEILSEPMRDIFVGETRNGWYATSHINFRGKRHRHTDTHYATILNIYGEGKTLDAAIDQFEINFKRKSYRIYETISLEGTPSPSKGLVVSRPVGRGVDI